MRIGSGLVPLRNTKYALDLMKLTVYNRAGNKTKRTVELDDAIFGIEPNDHVIWLDVRAIQAHDRQGTHKTKERGEVSKSRRKLYRQKGTGNARAGDARSPIRRGGGTIFGPKPHEYRLGVNRKTRQLARRSAMAYKVQSESLRIVEDFSMDEPKTSEMASVLSALDLTGKKVLLLTAGVDNMLYRSGRNIPRFTVCPASDVSTLDIMNAHVVLVQEGAVNGLSDTLRPAVKATSGEVPATETASAEAEPAEAA